MAKRDPKAFVTNQVLDEVLDEKLGVVVDTILEGMDNIIVELKGEMRSGFKKVDTRFDKVEAEISWVKDDVKGLTADLSGVVSKREFNEFKKDLKN